jgi:ammonia channel protein AmtB
LVCGGAAVFGQELSLSDLTVGLDTVWVPVTAFLVFFMQAGFGVVEAGFFAFGYAVMFGSGNGFIGTQGWFLIGTQSGADVPLLAFWLFQAAFCEAAAAGGIAAMGAVWLALGKPDFSMAMNRALAGLVAITAPCAFVEPWAAILIGTVGGVLVVVGALLLDRLKVEDPVGAFPVHGINGMWGTLSIGLPGRQALEVAHDGLFYGGGVAQLGI